ncbi:MAG: hypothetical protein WCP85_24945, partial [Mariniphaga sp.]
TNAEDGASVGNIFYGDKGYMVIKGYDSYETYLGPEKTPGQKKKEGGDHFKNFIDSVRAHDPSMIHAPVESAHLASALAHLGNIAYRTGRVLTFNPESESFVNDQEADKMLTRNYRTPYVVPENV